MGAIIYSVFGTIKFINVGAVASLAIMTGAATNGITPLCRILFANIVCLLGGILALLVGCTQLSEFFDNDAGKKMDEFFIHYFSNSFFFLHRV
jgi:MFS superfamily sulfate permease-like transporter